MTWRIVTVSGCAKLDYKMDFMVVRKQDATSRIYIGEIGLLIIESTTVSLTTALLFELTKKKVKVVFCDDKHNPNSELTPYYGSHDTSLKIKEQISWTKSIKEDVWTEIVREKIKKQMEVLNDYGYVERANLLRSYIYDIGPRDENNREGHAAKVYFNTLFGLSFSRSSENSINAGLNYGYGIILACFNREIVANGYITQLGLFHSSRFNHFNLACDLMEPFRPLVDRKVIKLSIEKFNKEEKLEILDLLNEEVVIEGKVNTINNAIKIYCKGIFDALNQNDISLLRFYRNEL